MQPDLDTLALFVKAAELRSLTRAADASHLALAAASRRIGQLERQLQVQLLVRTSKGVEPTPAGARLLEHAQAMLVQANQLRADMADFASGRKATLRVLANTSAITQYLPADLARFSHVHPQVAIALEERWSAEIVRRIATGDADVGIVMSGVRTIGLATRVYRTDQLAVVAPAGHPLTQGPSVSFEDLLHHELVGLEGDASLMRLLTRMATTQGKALRVKAQVRSFEAVCRLIQARLGLGLLPFHAASALRAELNLAITPLADAWATRSMLLCHREDHPRVDLVALFADLVCGEGVGGQRAAGVSSRGPTPAGPGPAG